MATTTTTTTTSLETTMTMTLTVTRPAETNRRLVVIAQSSDSIGSTIVSLHQWQQYLRRHGQSVSSTSSVSRLTATLSCIRTSLEQIRGYLMDDNTTVCGQFNRDLDVCAITGRTLAGKLGPVVTASSPPPPLPQVRLGNVTVVSAGNDNDGEGGWEPVKGGRRSGDEKPASRQFSFDINAEEQDGGVLARFQPFADHLLTGLQVLLKARSCTSSLDQELLLDNYTSREAIREVSQDQLDLIAMFNADPTPSYATRLKQGFSNLGSILLPPPSKVASTRLRKSPQSEPCSEKAARSQSLPRANTWPLLKQLDKKSWSNERAAARDAHEARKRSQLIDKQIEADLCNLNKKCLILTRGSEISMSLLMRQFMAKSGHYSTAGPAMDATQSRSKCVDAMRRHVRSEVNRMIQSAISADNHLAFMTDKPPNTKPFWTEDELKPLFSLQTRMEKEHAVLEHLVGPLERLWAWSKFREACKTKAGFRDGRLEAYNIFLVESFRRVSAADYTPTLADYHCASLLQGNRASRGTYDFDALSVSWVDFSVVGCCSPLLPKRGRRTAIFHDATTYVIFLDLAVYCMSSFNDGSDEGSDNALQHELMCIEGLDSSSNYNPQMSVTLVFSNVKFFRERLAKRPLSRKWFPEYMGEDGNGAQTIGFLVEMFRSRFTQRRVYTHVGEPEDPETTNFILGAVKDTKLNGVLNDVGVIRAGRK